MSTISTGRRQAQGYGRSAAAAQTQRGNSQSSAARTNGRNASSNASGRSATSRTTSGGGSGCAASCTFSCTPKQANCGNTSSCCTGKATSSSAKAYAANR
ncbi:MAG: hypothetical protein ACRC46_14285 [Thermoguttaceae bacterium]